ncbi:hypothetical protein [Klebsiella aerogenes]|uniref:hypothetical protein n=1 Tax=Klebsiella aerogenes TaxID=548 RepID=UPI0007A9B816|nr:hypothetical protein [Klebsiella aerogenes]SAJ14704.1 Uncharacterised protein [Klebsiella aerogenes]
MNNENELTAALLTIEKCRELSGCPAGVDLQDWVKQLAEENVRINHFIAASCYVQAGENASWCPAIDHAPETTATDAVLTELRNEAGARAVELFAKTLGSPYSFRDEKCYEDGFTRAIEIVRDAQAPRFAKKLREGADK